LISPTCLYAAFVSADPKSAKKYTQDVSLFMLLGSAHIKEAHNMLMKLNPGGNPKKLPFVNL